MSKRTAFMFIGIIVLVNVVSFYVSKRWDLTEDKRYSIAAATKSLLRNLDAPVVVTVYLDGSSLPGGFERLKRAVKETLAEFRNYGAVTYQFINPEELDGQQKKDLLSEFRKKGISPTTVFDQIGGKKTEIAIFPYAVVKQSDKEDVVLLLKTGQAEVGDSEKKLNSSFENVEYELASSIQKLNNTNKKNVGLLTEFTDRSPMEFMGMINALKDIYNLYIIDAKASASFDGLDALIVASPDKPVDDSTKFKIDQFVMKGGRVLFFVDGLKVDSIGLEGTYAQALNVNLDDMLYKYGLRINKNMVKDGLNAAIIPLIVGK